MVPETAIGGDGRTVRCAKCKHSWFQAPAPLDLTEQAGNGTAAQEPDKEQAAPPAPKPSASETATTDKPEPSAPTEEPPEPGPSISHWRTEDHPDSPNVRIDADPVNTGIAARVLKQSVSQDQEDTPAADPASDAFDSDPLANAGINEDTGSSDYDFDAAYDDQESYEDSEGSRFDYSPPFTRRRNSLKMWTIAAGVFAVLASGTAVAVNYYGLPDWFPVNRPTFGIGEDDLALDFPKSQQRKEVLESGEEIVRVRGSISNTGQATVAVPSLLIVFRDEREKNVYSWVVVPSKRELAPGESLNVTEAVTDIPASAKAVDIGWSPN